MVDEIRIQFEKKFSVPEGVEWKDGMYGPKPGADHAKYWVSERLHFAWLGFKAAWELKS